MQSHCQIFGWERGGGCGQTWSFMPTVMATAQQHIPAIPTRHRVRLPARSTSITCDTQNFFQPLEVGLHSLRLQLCSCFVLFFCCYCCCFLQSATHRRDCEDGVDHSNSNGGVDGLTDAGHFKDGRRVVKDLGSRKRKTVSMQKNNITCVPRSQCTENACFCLFVCVMESR